MPALLPLVQGFSIFYNLRPIFDCQQISKDHLSKQLTKQHNMTKEFPKKYWAVTGFCHIQHTVFSVKFIVCHYEPKFIVIRVIFPHHTPTSLFRFKKVFVPLHPRESWVAAAGIS